MDNNFQNLTNPIPGIAKGTAKPGGIIYVKLNNNRTIKARAGNEILTGNVLVFRDDNGLYTAYSENVREQGNKRTNTFFKARYGSIFGFYYHLKILFSIEREGNFEFYVGGDRKIPELIYTLPVANRTIYTAEITNTGKTIDDWIVTINYYDETQDVPLDNYPYTNEGYYTYKVLIIKPNQETPIVHSHPNFGTLLPIKHGCLMNYWNYYLTFASGFRTGWNVEDSTATLVNYLYASNVHNPNTMEGYIPSDYLTWWDNGHNLGNDIIMPGVATQLNPLSITFDDIINSFDSLGGYYDDQVLNGRTGWLTVDVTQAFDYQWNNWGDTTQYGLLDRSWAGLTTYSYGYSAYLGYFSAYNSSQNNGEFLTGERIEINISSGNYNLFNGGVGISGNTEFADGYKRFEFINNNVWTTLQMPLQNAATALTFGIGRLPFNITPAGGGIATTQLEIHNYQLEHEFSLLGFTTTWLVDSRYNFRLDSLVSYNNATNRYRKHSGFDSVISGDSIMLCQPKGAYFNWLRENFTYTKTANSINALNAAAPVPIYTYSNEYSLMINNVPTVLNMDDLEALELLDNTNTRLVLAWWLTDLIGNHFIRNVWNNDILQEDVKEWELRRYVIDTESGAVTLKPDSTPVLSLAIEDEDLENALWWSASYFE